MRGEDGTIYEWLPLPDLIQAMKTQRDKDSQGLARTGKDWQMIRRLIEADRAACSGMPSAEQARLWLREGRTLELLIDLAREFPDEARALAASRPLLEAAMQGHEAGVEAGLAEEERKERAADRAYWAPLKHELERMRHA